MKLKSIIIHNVKKEVKGKASIEFSNTELDSTNKKVESLLTELYSFFSKSIKYGIFSTDHKTMFSEKFDNYISSKNIDFINFTKTVLNDLKIRMNDITQSKGGYIIFAELENNTEEFFVVFVVRDKNGKQFSYNNNSIEINEVVHVDTNKLAMACRINIKSYLDKKDRYLSFLSTTQEDASKYFINWIGAEAQSKSQEDTKNLRLIINNIPIPKDSDGNEISRDKFRERVFAICNNTYSKIVNLRALSEEIWQNPDYISDYATSKNIIINDEFTADEKELKKLKKYTITADSIKLDFPPEYMGNKVYFDSTHNDTVIIKSKEFADKLRAEQ